MKKTFSLIKIVLSAILLAFVYQLFIIKNGFAPAGLNGIATMVQYKTGFSIAYMSLLINIPLCVLSIWLIDRTFALRSLLFCLVYSFVYLLLSYIDLSSFQYVTEGHDTIYPVILSGIFGGFVYGVCFKNSSSTGGTDIVSKYINKKKPELNFFYVTFTLNALVALASIFVYAKADALGNMIYDYKPVCLCGLYCFISSFIGSAIIKGTKTACEFTVITSHPDEISEAVARELRHGCTKIKAEGAYSHGERTVLICVVNKHQIIDFQNILANYDNTFSYYKTVNETYGNFKKIK